MMAVSPATPSRWLDIRRWNSTRTTGCCGFFMLFPSADGIMMFQQSSGSGPWALANANAMRSPPSFACSWRLKQFLVPRVPTIGRDLPIFGSCRGRAKAKDGANEEMTKQAQIQGGWTWVGYLDVVLYDMIWYVKWLHWLHWPIVGDLRAQKRWFKDLPAWTG